MVAPFCRAARLRDRPNDCKVPDLETIEAELASSPERGMMLPVRKGRSWHPNRWLATLNVPSDRLAWDSDHRGGRNELLSISYSTP